MAEAGGPQSIRTQRDHQTQKPWGPVWAPVIPHWRIFTEPLSPPTAASFLETTPYRQEQDGNSDKSRTAWRRLEGGGYSFIWYMVSCEAVGLVKETQ